MAYDPDFNDSVAALMNIWGVPHTPARLFAHLLLQAEPASLDELAEQLDIGKTTAGEATRLMERYGFLRRHKQSGSKRVLFAPADDFTRFFLTQASYLEQMAKVMSARSAKDAPGPTRDRLDAMAGYYERLGSAIHQISQEFLQSRGE